MGVPLPDPELVLAAVDAYLDAAYEGPPPAGVVDLVAPLRSAGAESLLDLPSFERGESDAGTRYSLRLGNTKYPFMKLTVEPRPDGLGYLFKADTHDRHICPPPESPEHGAFMELMAFNEALAATIERFWEERDVPTFKSWLRADLARRKGGRGLD